MTAMAHRDTAGGWRTFFWLAAAYDMVLGVAFFLFWEPIFERLGMAVPGDVAYIQLSAVFVFVQGLSYALVALDPARNLGLVRVGVAYKAGYSGLALWYLVTEAMPSPFFAWFGLFDFLFLIAFAWYLREAGRQEALG